MARERYLLDDTEDTIHQNQIVPTTAKEKRANWWYYYKWFVVGGILIAAFVGYFIYTMVTKINPDYTIAMMTSYVMPVELQEDVQTMIEKYADDRNGDGRTVVQISHFFFTDNPQSEYEFMQMQASQAQFAADAGSGDSIIYLYDDYCAEFFKLNEYEGYIGQAGDMTGENMLWADIPGLNTLVVDKYSSSGATTESALNVLGKLHVSVRTEDGVAFDKESVREYRADSIALLNRLIHDEPYSGE